MKLFIAIVMLAASSLPATPQTIDDISNKLGHVSKIIDLRNQIDAEFLDLSDELSKLHSPRVNKIMLPHITKIQNLEAQIMEK